MIWENYYLAALITSISALILTIIVISITISFSSKKKNILMHIQASSENTVPDAQLLKESFFSIISPISSFAKKIGLGKKKYAKTKLKLLDAGQKITPYDLIAVKTFLTFIAILTIYIFALFRIINIGFGTTILFGAIIGIIGPQFYVSSKGKSRIKAIKRDFIPAIKLVSNSMIGGYSIPQAINVVAETQRGAIGIEFARIGRDIGIGYSIEEATKALSRRVLITETKMLANVISINNEVGGDIITAFQNAIDTVTETSRLQSKIKTATANAKASAKIVGLLPLGIFLILFLLTGGEYFAPLWSTTIGLVLFGTALVLQITGFIIIQKMSNLDL